MKRVKAIEKGGVLTPESQVKSVGFGTSFDGEYYLIFESQQEAIENTPEIPSEPVMGAAIQALMSATPEEIEQIKNMLK